MELILVRHGLPERVENDDGTPADPPLSAAGRQQAERVAQWLARERIERVYASPLRRAVETAQPLAAALSTELRIEPGVSEFDQDAQHYVPLEELKRTDYARWRQLMESGFAGAFDPEVFRANVVRAIESIIGDNRGARVAVVCHGGVINVWAAHLLGLPRAMFFGPHYTSINRFMAAGSGQRSIVSLNETGHLREA
jgi:probable phosphoglycerate mutase